MKALTDEQAVLEGSVHSDVVDSLVAANELGDGTFEYYADDNGGALFVNVYGESLDEAGFPVPQAVYRIDITTTLQEES